MSDWDIDMNRRWTAKMWREFIGKESVDIIEAEAIVDDLEKAEKRIKALNKKLRVWNGWWNGWEILGEDDDRL